MRTARDVAFDQAALSVSISGVAMKTREFVSMLATGIFPTPPHVVALRFSAALFLGLTGAACMVVALYGVRGDMPQMLVTPLFWIKVAFPLAVVGASLSIVMRVSRPGADATMAWIALAIPLALVWAVALVVIVAAPATLRLQLVLGNTWQVCTMNIAVLSVPTFIAVFWAMKGLAPTQPVIAGAAAGLLSGAQAVLVYMLYCVEMTVPFWGVWYVLGMLVPTVVGAVLGPRLLRW
ncbi:DUF1109 domain-containing protein [Caballeronia sordidicola]|uniref:Extracytoplasmic function alternative sigma factor n=2 Tax=Burkholderiaceae TaxID=119060 RepID=A0A242M5B7_CABSO|nr:DUF1109 domain-containing protein [Caballeronia sordidicola]OTP66388.1 extracytoplasmic function alternative sigma factor [Caballeronia sordidicola]